MQSSSTNRALFDRMNLFKDSYRQVRVAMHLAAKRQGKQQRMSEQEMKELVGYPSRIDPRGNPAFIENIYKTMEKEFTTK